MIYQGLPMTDDLTNLLAFLIMDNSVNSEVANKRWSVKSL